MNKKLFTNVVTFQGQANEVLNILTNPTRLLNWVPDIMTVDEVDNTFKITRTDNAFNQTEMITVITTNQSVTYQSTGGRLAYDLVFDITQTDQIVQVSESLFVNPASDNHLPLTLLTPIVKHAFNQNLDGLARIVSITN